MTLCPSSQGDGLEIHWALPAGVRIPSVSFLAPFCAFGAVSQPSQQAPRSRYFSMFLGLLPSSDFPDRRFSGQDTPQQASYGPCAWDLGLGMHGRGAWYHLCFTSTDKQSTHHTCSSSKQGFESPRCRLLHHSGPLEPYPNPLSKPPGADLLYVSGLATELRFSRPALHWTGRTPTSQLWAMCVGFGIGDSWWWGGGLVPPLFRQQS